MSLSDEDVPGLWSDSSIYMNIPNHCTPVSYNVGQLHNTAPAAEQYAGAEVCGTCPVLA
jgi:hypothetical protein